MNEKSNNFIIKWLNLFKLSIRKSTNKEQIISLIRSLHPFSIDKDLIRLGPDEDGGYLIPDDLAGIEACFSPGVGQVSGFEKECASRGIKVFLADKSVETPTALSENFHFTKKFVGSTVNEDYITLDHWVNSSNLSPQSDLLLQMDIEGDEYSTFKSISNSLLKRFRIIVIEFHNLHKLWDENFYYLASAVFEKIIENHTCVHIHPNNFEEIHKQNGVEIPRVAEFTFIRNDRITIKIPQTVFPHKLDIDNTKDKAHIPLPKDWYKSHNNM